MKIIGDFHIHSRYSMATSKNLTPEWLDFWARAKGITVMGTGDFTHPSWLAELQEKLEPAEQGLFRLKNEYKQSAPWVQNANVRFMLTAEVSSIYKKMGKTRKVHNIIWSPDFETATKIQNEFEKRNFNITSDGRPIIGFDSQHLLDLCLNANENIFFVPAHIWTPWFSALGAKSGFDSIEECYGSLSDNIYAVETGLSSDPPMNWMISSLDKYALIANSDAHSPEKIGRNANIFDCELSYNAIVDALKSKDPQRFIGTIDMFPQEGKYHFAGHRKCNVCTDPTQTLEYNFNCPQCGKPLILGVMNRIAQLSDREDVSTQQHRSRLTYCISLKDILAEIYRVGENTKKVKLAYEELIGSGTSELKLLLDTPIDEIAGFAPLAVTEGIKRMRTGNIFISEGFDGEYGRIKVFDDSEWNKEQKCIVPNASFIAPKRPLLNFDLKAYRKIEKNIVYPNEAAKNNFGQLSLFD